MRSNSAPLQILKGRVGFECKVVCAVNECMAARQVGLVLLECGRVSKVGQVVCFVTIKSLASRGSTCHLPESTKLLPYQNKETPQGNPFPIHSLRFQRCSQFLSQSTSGHEHSAVCSKVHLRQDIPAVKGDVRRRGLSPTHRLEWYRAHK